MKNNKSFSLYVDRESGRDNAYIAQAVKNLHVAFNVISGTKRSMTIDIDLPQQELAAKLPKDIEIERRYKNAFALVANPDSGKPVSYVLDVLKDVNPEDSAWSEKADRDRIERIVTLGWIKSIPVDSDLSREELAGKLPSDILVKERITFSFAVPSYVADSLQPGWRKDTVHELTPPKPGV